MSDVARLDTCITVVDAAEFYNNLDSMKVSLKKFDYSSLLIRSVGRNKCDLGSGSVPGNTQKKSYRDLTPFLA